MRFDDLLPGDLFKHDGRNFVKIDPNCEFAESLGRWHAVEVGTGVITFLGPDNIVDPLVRRCERTGGIDDESID